MRRLKFVLLGAIGVLFALAMPATQVALAQAPTVYLNEIQVSTTSTDWEFVEIQGTPGTSLDGLTLVGIESDSGASQGTIDRVIDLTGQTIPADGFWVGASPEAQTVYALTPDMAIVANAFENSTATYLLVYEFTGSQGTDYDGNDDYVLDSTPWTSVVDEVGIRDGGASDNVYSAVDIGPDGSFLPSGTYRCPDAPTGVFSNSNIHNFSSPDGTPGVSNRQCAVDVYLNEIQVSTTSTDWEFVEIQGTPGTSLDGLTLVGIESDSGASQGTIDRVIDLTGQTIPADGFWVGASPEAQTVYGLTPDMAIVANAFENSTATYLLVQDFTGSQGTDYDGNDDYALDSMPWGVIIDGLGIRDGGASDQVYAAVAIGPDGSFLPSGTYRCPDAPTGTFSNDNLHNFSSPDGTPGYTNASQCVVGSTNAFIHEIQGSGDSVTGSGPFLVEAIVVGDYQLGDQLGGFFIQEEDNDTDADPATSEGIFVYCDSCSVDVNVGDLVSVTGEASDYFDMSQLTATEVSVISSGNSLPSAASIDLPVVAGDINAFYEQFEGMLVTFSDTLYVAEYFSIARYGQVTLYEGGRPYQYTHMDDTPTAPEHAAHLEDLDRRRVIMDDDDNTQNSPLPNGVIYYPQPGGLAVGTHGVDYFRGNDTVSNLTGVLHWSYAGQSGTDAWRIRPVDPAYTATFTPANPRPLTAPDVGGNLKVASFNVLNYFSTYDDGPDVCGPASDQDCRGADSQAEFDRQGEKIVAAMAAIDADIVGVMEIENNTDAAIALLVAELNAALGAGTYDYIPIGNVGSDAITVGIIYKPSTVTPVGPVAVLDDASFVDPLSSGSDKNRPAVAQTFSTGSDALTVVVNHLKSKGSGCGVGDDDPMQGNCNGTRTAAAVVLADWLATDPTDTLGNLGGLNQKILIIGDLNSYAGEDPIDALKDAGYQDMTGGVGSANYSYLFDGQVGYLDYAMASGQIVSQITGVSIWNINADELPLFDYNNYVDDGGGEASFEREPDGNDLSDASPFRSSDHDPVIVGLDLNSAPVCSTAYPSVASLWPANHKMVAIDILGVTDVNGDALTYTIDSIFQDEPVDANGDGNTAPDGLIIGPYSIELRAERNAQGNGRVYHISFTITDGEGGACSGVVQVLVPRNRGKNNEVIDDGPLFDSTVVPE